jgi:hypothetical protein
MASAIDNWRRAFRFRQKVKMTDQARLIPGALPPNAANIRQNVASICLNTQE